MTNCPHCHKPILNVYEQQVFDTVKKRKKITPLELATLRKTTAQNTNNILKKLTDGGLLKRTQVIRPQGGLEFVYTLNDK